MKKMEKNVGMEMVQFGLLYHFVAWNSPEFLAGKNFSRLEDLSEKLKSEEVDLTEVRGCRRWNHSWMGGTGGGQGRSLNDLCLGGDQRSSKLTGNRPG